MRVHRSCPFTTPWPTFLYKSHGKSVPVAVTAKCNTESVIHREKKRRKKKRKEANTREKFHRIVIEAPREPFWAGRVYRSGDNRTQFLASLLWSGFTPSSSPFLPPSIPLPPHLLGAASDAAANLIQPRLRGKRLT